MGVFPRKGLTALHYLEQKRYGRKKAELAEEDQALMQEDLDKIGVWMSLKALFLLSFLAPCALFTAWEMEMFFQKKSFLEKEKERPMGIQKKVGKKAFAVDWKNGKKGIPISKMSLDIGKVIGFVGKEFQAQL